MMAVHETLDLTDKASWRKRPEKLASVFGYKNNDDFQQALEWYREEIVKPASCTQFLGILAVGFFRQYKPPLIPLE